METIVRFIQETDLADIHKLLTTYGFPISIHDLQYRYNLYKKSLLNQGWIAIDALSQQLIGYIAVIVNKSIREQKTSARVINLFVAPPYRRLGIGKKLLAAVEEYLASLGKTNLEVIMSEINPDIAQKFYSTLGYTQAEDRNAFITTINEKKPTEELIES